ncbi:MAG: glycosyltransferase [bacterium]
MKILQVIPYFYPALQYGGIISAVMGLSKALAQKGHHVIVATTTADGAAELGVTLNSAVKMDGFEVIYFRRIRWERAFAAIPYLGQTVGFFYSPALRGYLKQAVQDFDIVHVHEIFCYPAIKAAKIARSKKVPYFVHIHSVLNPERFARRKFKKTIYMNFIGRKLLNRAHGVIAVTKAEREDLANFNITSNIEVIPNATSCSGIDNSTNGPRDDIYDLGNKKVILFLGRLHLIKGLDLLIDAYAKIAHKHPDSVLVIAGPDEIGYQKTLMKQASDLRLDGQIKFLGLVKGDEKAHLLRRCDVFALTSYSEGFSLAVLEALAYGKPVVITEGCHFDDVGTHYAGFVNPPEPDAIAHSLESLLKDADLCHRLGENARNLIQEKYTWDSAAEKTLAFYERAVAVES